MYFIKANDCINCGVCAGECPKNAISKQENSFFIDSAKCDNCGICEHFCPVDAIYNDDNKNSNEENKDDF